MNNPIVEQDVEADEAMASDVRQIRTPQPFALPWLIVCIATILAQLFSVAFGRVDATQSFISIVLPSLLFVSALTLPLSAIGIKLGQQIGLGTPLLTALLYRQTGSIAKLKSDAGLAITLGLGLGALLLVVRVLCAPYLPQELPAFGHRGVMGGLAVSIGAAMAEEVWFRLGLMTLLLWCVVRLSHRNTITPFAGWVVIGITAVGFGLAHLPQLMAYGAGSTLAILATMLGNIMVSMLFGWCYWRRSLIAAILAHFAVDVVLHVLPALI